jgi:small-conductance mechanosensitive channel
MDWIETLNQILNFEVVVIGGSAITAKHILLFTVVLLITRFAARTSRRVLGQHVLASVESAPRYVILRITGYGVWVIGIVVALNFLSIDMTSLAVVAGGLGIGIGFGLQNVVANFVSGLVLLLEQPIRIHDRVTVENVEGNVVDIHFRSTTIVTNDNIAIIVPNSQFINQSVTNWSHGDPTIRVHVPVGVAYGSDVALVTRVLEDVASAAEHVLNKPAPEVRFNEFGDSSLNFELLVWSDDPPGHFQLRSRLNYAIDAAFRKHDIEIPFPQRVLHIESGEISPGE